MKLFSIVSVSELLVICCLSRLASGNKLPLSKRVDLAHRNGLLSIEGMLQGEQDRIAFITARINGAGKHAEGGRPVSAVAGDDPALGSAASSSVHIPLLSGKTIGSVNYVIRVGLGTPPQDLYLAIDTGSDLAWTQCVPCAACFAQHDPIFDPAASSSYQQVSCTSPQCAQVGFSNAGSCHNASTHCVYLITYLDQSYTTGEFALEALTLGGNDHPVSAAYPFGCGHENQGLFRGLDGILGLNRDALAFPAQTKAEFGGRFAYCMPDIFLSGAVGYMEFGQAATGRGDESSGGRSTPLVGLSTEFYIVDLEEVEVEGKISKPTAAGSAAKSKMAMVVDSGTVITRLDRPLYEQVRDAFKDASAALKMEEAAAGAGLGAFDTCYTITTAVQAEILIPRITFTFLGGLAFTPPAQHSLVPLGDNSTFCLAILPLDSSSGFSILGNYHQQGYLFTFDIPHSSLSISSHPCL